MYVPVFDQRLISFMGYQTTPVYSHNGGFADLGILLGAITREALEEVQRQLEARAEVPGKAKGSRLLAQRSPFPKRIFFLLERYSRNQERKKRNS